MAGALLGIGVVALVAAVVVIATGMGAPALKDRLIVLGCWAVTMLIFASPAGERASAQLVAAIPDMAVTAIVTISFIALGCESVVARYRFKDQVKAVKARMPQAPITSFKRVVARRNRSSL